MNKDQYNALGPHDKKLVDEAYLDGFKAAIEAVKSLTVRVGDEKVDAIFISNRNMVVSILESNLKLMDRGVHKS